MTYLRIFCGLFIGLFFCGSLYADSYEIFIKDGKQGLKDYSGKVVIPPKFERLGWSDGSSDVKNKIIGFKDEGYWGLVTLDNETIYPSKLEAVYDATRSYIVAGRRQEDGNLRKGLLTYEGKELVTFQYEILQLHSSYLVGMKSGKCGLIDIKNRVLIPFLYKDINPLNGSRWEVINDQNKAALFDYYGEQLTDFIADSLTVYTKSRYQVHKDHLVGLMDGKGNWLLPMEFKHIKIVNSKPVGVGYNKFYFFKESSGSSIIADSIRYLEKGYIQAYAKDLQWLIDENLKKVSPIGKDIIYGGDHIAIKFNRYYQLYDINSGELIEPDHFKEVSFINENLIFVKRSNKNFYDLLDASTLKKIDSHITSFSKLNDGLLIEKKNAWGWLNEKGNQILSPVYEGILQKQGNLFVVKLHGQYGVVNKDEKWLCLPQDEKIIDLQPGVFISYNGRTYNLYDFEGDFIYFSSYPLSFKAGFVKEELPGHRSRRLDYKGRSIRSLFGDENYEEILPLKEGLIGICHQGLYGFVDPQSRLLIANRYEDIQSFNEGIAPVKIREKWGAINKREQLVVQPVYDSLSSFFKGLAMAYNGKVGLIDQTGDILQPFTFDSFDLVNNSYYKVKKDNKEGAVSLKGKTLIWPRFDSIEKVNSFFKVKKGGQFGLYNESGVAVLPPNYRFILPLSDNKILLGIKADN